MQEEFLSLGEYVDFDLNTKGKIDREFGKLRSSFRYIPDDDKRRPYDDTLLLAVYPMVQEVMNYYNNEICLAVAICKTSLSSNNMGHRVVMYHSENAVFRLISVWDYIMVILGKYFDTELMADFKTRDKLVERLSYEYEFVPYGNGYRIIAKPKEGDPRSIRKAIRSIIKVLNIGNKKRDNVLFSDLKKKYSLKGRIQKIFDYCHSEPVCELRNIRHELIHKGSLGARLSVGLGDIGMQEAFNFSSEGNFDKDHLVKLIVKNASIVKEGIQLLHDVIWLDDFPNLKENEGRTYQVGIFDCNECEVGYYVPDEIIVLAEFHKVGLVCPHCFSANTTFDQWEPVNEKIYYQKYLRYLDDIKETIGSNDVHKLY